MNEQLQFLSISYDFTIKPNICWKQKSSSILLGSRHFPCQAWAIGARKIWTTWCRAKPRLVALDATGGCFFYGWLRLVVEEWTIENESGGLTLITKSGFDMIEAPEIRISALTMRYPGVTMMWNQTIPATALANRCHEVACFPVEIEILVGLVGWLKLMSIHVKSKFSVDEIRLNPPF